MTEDRKQRTGWEMPKPKLVPVDFQAQDATASDAEMEGVAMVKTV